jgi:hypothetical protein
MLLALMLGCGDDPGAGAASCNEYASRYCERSLTCQVADTKENCVADVKSAFLDNTCNRATGVENEATFATCLTELDSYDCNEIALGNLPPSCVDQIQF